LGLNASGINFKIKYTFLNHLAANQNDKDVYKG